jgi:hypothetical protein
LLGFGVVVRRRFQADDIVFENDATGRAKDIRSLVE